MYSLAALGWYCLTGRAPEPGAQRPPLPLLVPGSSAGAGRSAGSRTPGGPPATAFCRRARSRRASQRCGRAVDLSVSVHPTVIPQLLTRRTLPGTARARRAERLRLHHRRFPKPRPAELRSGGTARHSARRGSSRSGLARPKPAGRTGYRRGYRAAAVGLALAGCPRHRVGVRWCPDALTVAQALPTSSHGRPSVGVRTSSRGARADCRPAIPPEVQDQLASTDPEEAVRGLARLRSLAFSSGDFGLLDQVNVPASSAAVADGRISAGLGSPAGCWPDSPPS